MVPAQRLGSGGSPGQPGLGTDHHSSDYQDSGQVAAVAGAGLPWWGPSGESEQALLPVSGMWTNPQASVGDGVGQIRGQV